MNINLFKSFEFFLLLPILLMLINFSKRGPQFLYPLVLATVSLFIIMALPFVKLGYVVFLLGFLGLQYFILLVFQSWSEQKLLKQKKRVLTFFTMSLVMSFALLKLSFWRGFSPLQPLSETLAQSILPAIGYAYVLVKLYSLYIDIRAGKAKLNGFVNYLNYFLFFPTFLAGPIMRWKDWQTSQVDSQTQSGLFNQFSESVPRLIFGCLKTFTIAPFLKPYILASLKAKEFSQPQWVYLGLVTYYMYEYINFSGYSDLAIATGRMLGFKVPENFNQPYLGHGLTGLWRRWHMTLAHWLRDYIFYPLSFFLSGKIKKRSKFKLSAVSALSIFITFVFCGIWHGDSYGILYFGISSGLIMAGEVFIEGYIGPYYKSLLKKGEIYQRILPFVLKVLTFHVACVSFGPVLMSNEKFVQFFSRFF